MKLSSFSAYVFQKIPRLLQVFYGFFCQFSDSNVLKLGHNNPFFMIRQLILVPTNNTNSIYIAPKPCTNAPRCFNKQAKIWAFSLFYRYYHGKCSTGLSNLVSVSHVLHLFGIPCLVHVSLHSTIYPVSRGISIPTFSSSESIYFLFFIHCSPEPWAAFSLVQGKYAFKKIK